MTIPDDLYIRELQQQDIEPIAAAFAQLGWNKPAAQYMRYLAEQDAGERVVLVAFVEDAFAGYLTILWRSDYLPFQAADIPEISDFNVVTWLRQRKIGTRLMDAAEARIAQRAPVAGIGVGMYPDYGPAQRLYVLRGYVPDGRGLATKGRPLHYGDSVVMDDDLVLYFTKKL